MARSEGGASPQRAVTTERHRQLPFCLAPATVALILALAFVARWAEIAADIGAALRALANAKIHSNATHSSISTVSEDSRRAISRSAVHLSGKKIAGARRVVLFVRRFRCGRGVEFLEAGIVPERIEHRIEPE